MNTADELKPCPFCGGEAEMDTGRAYRAIDNGKIGTSVAVYCRGCTADVGVCKEDFLDVPVEELVILVTNAWNRRSSPQGTADERARLVERERFEAAVRKYLPADLLDLTLSTAWTGKPERPYQKAKTNDLYQVWQAALSSPPTTVGDQQQALLREARNYVAWVSQTEKVAGSERVEARKLLARIDAALPPAPEKKS